jgi:hypothetical protein
MKNKNHSLLIVPTGNFRDKGFPDFLMFIRKLQEVISHIDHDTTVKQTFDMVMLKNNKIKQFKGRKLEEFHQDVLDAVESSGTQFLISKN